LPSRPFIPEASRAAKAAKGSNRSPFLAHSRCDVARQGATTVGNSFAKD
jgi:hypothetical protein